MVVANKEVNMNIGAIVGLIMFVIGIILLVVWSANTSDNSGFLLPGIVVAGGGFAVIALFARGGGE
jgi:hypothetical protein